jgi:hypothetical protein
MKAFLRREYIASCEKRGREIDGVSDDPVFHLVSDYESAEDAKAELQKLKQLHHKGIEGTSVLFALISYGCLVLGIICLHKVDEFDAASSEPSRAEHS